MKTHLKIKIKSLAAEAQIIRREEKKWPGPSRVRESLCNHRRVDVRQEARASLLAYGFLRKRDYKQLEAKTHEDNAPDWDRVVQIASKFGSLDRRTAAQSIAEWRSVAEAA